MPKLRELDPQHLDLPGIELLHAIQTRPVKQRDNEVEAALKVIEVAVIFTGQDDITVGQVRNALNTIRGRISELENRIEQMASDSN